MISIASFNQTYRLIHSYATFFASLHSRQYACTFFFSERLYMYICAFVRSHAIGLPLAPSTQKKKSDYSKSKHDVLVTLVILAPPAACRRRRGGGGGRSESDVLDGADGVEEEAAI